MPSITDAATLLSTSVEEPTPVSTPPIPSPAHPAFSAGSGRLSPSSVNQRSPVGVHGKISRLAPSSSSLTPKEGGEDMPKSPPSTAMDGCDATTTKTAAGAAVPSGTSGEKENAQTRTHTTLLASPRTTRTPRATTTTTTTTAAAALPSSAPSAAGNMTDRGRGHAAAKSGEALDSPPVVPVTVTRRLTKSNDAPPAEEEVSSPTPAPTASAGAQPLRTPRTVSTSPTPLLSPRRRAAAAGTAVVGGCGGAATATNVAPPASARLLKSEAKEVNATESNDAAPLALPDTTAQSSSPPTSPISPRQRVLQTAPAGRAADTSLPSSPSPSTGDLAGPHAKSPAEDGKEKSTAAPEESKEATQAPATPATAPAALATPRGSSMASRVEEIRARLAASRRESLASAPRTPRSSVGSVATAEAVKTAKGSVGSAHDAAGAGAAKEVKQAVKDKDKEKEMAALAKEKIKMEQLLEKMTKKAADLQGKWEAEKAAFATFKKEATALKLDSQKELRQAQNTARVAQAAQERLQKELEKQKEKLAAAVTVSSSRTASASTTPMATPRGVALSANTSLMMGSAATDAEEMATLRLQLAQCEKAKTVLKESMEKLKKDTEANTAATVAAAVKECEVQKAAMEAASKKEVAKLKACAAQLTKSVAECEAALAAKEAELQTLTADVEHAKADYEQKERLWLAKEATDEEKKRQRLQGGRADAFTMTEGDYPALEPTPPLPQEQPSSLSSPPRSPRQVVTFELPAKKATAQLQEELTATQHQVSAYKRMQEHADRRIEQLEAELESMQNRARDAVEALQEKLKEEKERRATATSDATALEATKKELAKVRQDCAALKERAQESGEEAVTLKSALVEAEDERDVFERQLRDLQQEHSKFEWETRSAMEALKTQATQEAKELQGLLEATRQELHVAEEAALQKDTRLMEMQTQVEELRRRCDELKQQAAQAREARSSGSADDASTKQVEHYKKKARTLTKRLAEAEKELQVLGEEYTRVCSERDAAVLRCCGEDDDAKKLPQQVLTIDREHQQHEEHAKADVSLHSDGVAVDSVSRDLSDALLSANRGAPTCLHVDGRSVAASVTAMLAQEQQARVHLEREVAALQSKMTAMEHLASPIMNPLLTDSVESLPSVDAYDLAPPPQRGISAVPPRARSPQTTHALDLRFFDPTSAETVGRTAVAAAGEGEGNDRVTGPSRSVSLFTAAAAGVSPRPSQAFLTVSPQRSGGLRAAGPIGRYGTRESALDAIYAEVPPPPVYTAFGCNRDSCGAAASGASAAALASSSAANHRAALLFSTTAGCLLVSKQGRQLHRPLVATSSAAEGVVERAADDSATEACYAALTSMSHAIYASRMSAAGLYHLQHKYRFVIRVLTDCATGEVLVGFADRYIPLESFGVRRNALKYHGCYYVSLQGGVLYAPSQGIRGESYAGWSAAAETVAARRWQRCRGLARGVERGTAVNPSASSCLSSPSQRAVESSASPDRVARAGDEIACTLRLDERSISFEWNGVECGVAFTGVSLSPSLYPCVEVNCSGGTVELL